MAKTYTAVPNVSTLQTYTASAYNTYTATNVSNLIVPPSVSVFRSSNLSSYSTGSAITWQDKHYDTDGMWSSGAPTVISIGTTGLYALHFQGQVTGTATMQIVAPEIKRSAVNIMSGFSAIYAGVESRFSLFGVVSLTAGDSLTADVTVVSGSAYSIVGGATYGEAQTRLSLTWIGRTS